MFHTLLGSGVCVMWLYVGQVGRPGQGQPSRTFPLGPRSGVRGQTEDSSRGAETEAGRIQEERWQPGAGARDSVQSEGRRKEPPPDTLPFQSSLKSPRKGGHRAGL